VDSLGSTSPVVEAEVCAAVADALSELGFTDFVIRMNHRQLLASLLAAAGVPPDRHGSTLVALDKLDKIGVDGVMKELAERGLEDAARTALLSLFQSSAAEAELGRVESFIGDDPAGRSALDNVREVLALLPGTPAAGKMRIDPSLARGLSYYTGAIWEINVADLPGSLGAGGRYDNLVGIFLGQNIPACGFSLGLERILVVMGERNMFPASLAMTPADVMIATFDASSAPAAMRLAATLREQGLRVLVYPDADKIGKQIKYADGRGIPFVALLGENEIRGGTVTVKDLAAQTKATYGQAEAGVAIRDRLRQRG
jgi:histidyl-tRNA synthetase